MKFISITVMLSLPIMALISSNTFVPVPNELHSPTNTILPASTYTDEPTITPTETPIAQDTETAMPATLVNTEDGRQLINSKYGFTITLPSDGNLESFNPTDDKLLSIRFPPMDLPDGGNILTYLYVWVENHTDGCHAGFTNSYSSPVKIEQVILGGTTFTKAYTPDLDQYETQAIEYMSYGTDFCVHFFIGLTMYYFDRRGAEPGNMLPYVQGELDSMISTFHWVKE